MKRENISVCMATYNGEKFILAQIESILKQLQVNDELIIVDDCSTDKTVSEIIKLNDKRINVFRNNERLGVNRNFEKAIEISKNEFIFLADQDDIWTENRVDIMLKELKKREIFLVSGNTIAIDEAENIINFKLGKLIANKSLKKFENNFRIFFGNAYYYGCAMAFKRQLLSIIFPFPRYIESHDLWIAMAAINTNHSEHLENIVLKRRIHGKNASVINRKMIKKIYSRVIFLKSFIEINRRAKSEK